jgi:drug/metabolite transporter (DMT)-like permease
MPSATALAAVAALGIICTAVALIAYFYLIAEAGPGKASIITYLNPAVAVVLGFVVLGESVSMLTVGELLLIIAGSWFSTDGRIPPGGRRVLLALRAAAARARGYQRRRGYSSGPADVPLVRPSRSA